MVPRMTPIAADGAVRRDAANSRLHVCGSELVAQVEVAFEVGLVRRATVEFGARDERVVVGEVLRDEPLQTRERV